MSRASAPEAAIGPARSACALALPLAAAALLYALTIAPTVYWGDGMELTAAAHCLGVAHPPGYPLYVWLGRLFLWLPFGEPGLRMNLFSAVSALLAAGLWFGLSGELLRLVRPRVHPRNASSLAARAVWTFAFAVSLGVWQHAVRTEVYALFAAAHVGCLWLATRAFRMRSPRAGLALAFVWGLAWQAHYLALLLAPPIGALALAGILRRAREKRVGSGGASGTWPLWKMGALGTAFFCVGVSGYFALPLRARANPPMNWGDVSSLDRWIAHMTGGQFKQTKILSDPLTGHSLHGAGLRRHLERRSLEILAWPARQWTPEAWRGSRAESTAGALLWLAALGGLATVAWRRPMLGAGWLGSLALGIAVYLTYSIVDIEDYFIGLWPTLLLLLFALLIRIPARSQRLSGIVPGFGLLLAAAGVFGNFAACDLSGDREAAEFGERLLELTPENALLLTSGDTTTYAMWHYQTVEGRRNDIIVFDCNFVFQGWYLRYFEGVEGVPLFAVDRPPKGYPEFLVALGGGVIGPNMGRRPIMVAVSDTHLLDSYFRSYWRAEFVAPLFDISGFSPKVTAVPPARALYRLHDNEEYREYQAAQFEEMFGLSVDPAP